MKEQYLAPYGQGNRKRLQVFSRVVIPWDNGEQSLFEKVVVFAIRTGFVAVLAVVILVVAKAIS